MVLGAAWLVGGVLAFAIALFAIAQVIIDPSAAEGGFWGGFVFVMVLLVLGAILSVNGLALLRRNPVARPLIAISSLVLLILSVPGLASLATGGNPTSVLALLVVVPSLWLTLSGGGKKAFESYVARANG